MSGIDTVYMMIQDDVKRPDKQAVIWRRIHRSILKHHRIDQWKKDLIEQEFNFSPLNNAAAVYPPATGANSLFMTTFGQTVGSAAIQVIDTLDLVRFRKVKYLKKWTTVNAYGRAIIDPDTGNQGTVQGGDLFEKSADSLFDGYGYDQQDIYYLSGTDIKINSSTPLSKVYIGYYSDPKVTLDCNTEETFRQYQSWIVDTHPGIIVADVKKFIFGDIGKLEAELKLAQDEYTGELATLQASQIQGSTRGT